MDMIKIKKWLLVSGMVSASTLLSHFALAQEAGVSAVVNSRLTYDDNILRAAKEAEQSDTSLVVAPELTLAGILGKQRFSAVYKGEYAKYADNSDVDYDDHDIRLRAELDHSNRFTSRFDVQYQDKHEDFGDVSNIFTNLTEFNHFTQTDINGRITYGRQDSFGQLVLGLGRSNKDYDNNGQEYRSNDRDLASLAFYYRIAPRTRLLAEVIYQDISYNPDAGFIDLDNEYVRYQAGLEWALTNQLEGTVKVGYQDRKYQVDTINDIDGLAYEASIDYTPNTFTTINVAAKRESLDSSLAGTGGFLRSSYSVGAKHGLTDLLKLDGQVYYAKDDGVFGGTRQDKRLLTKVGLIYSALYWVDVGVNYSFEERDSTTEAADYQSNSINLTVKVAFN
jgi:hypothetical protein